jgi:hypothetical protein
MAHFSVDKNEKLDQPIKWNLINILIFLAYTLDLMQKSTHKPNRLII